MKKYTHSDVNKIFDNIYIKAIPLHLIDNVTIEYVHGKILTVSRDQIMNYFPSVFLNSINIDNLDVTPDIKNVTIKLDTHYLSTYLNDFYEELMKKVSKC